MDVYDFDNTLYRGDSTADFMMWCARRYPRVLATLPRTAVAAVACFALHAIDKTRFKGVLYRFLPLVPDIESEVRRFWDARHDRISGPCNPKPGDVVISGSPEFLLRDVCAQRGLRVLASPVAPHTGRRIGANCSEAEKVVRFNAAFPDEKVERFFSDSRNDDPMAAIAEEAFMVKAGAIVPWDWSEQVENGPKRLR